MLKDQDPGPRPLTCCHGLGAVAGLGFHRGHDDVQGFGLGGEAGSLGARGAAGGGVRVLRVVDGHAADDVAPRLGATAAANRAGQFLHNRRNFLLETPTLPCSTEANICQDSKKT